MYSQPSDYNQYSQYNNQQQQQQYNQPAYPSYGYDDDAVKSMNINPRLGFIRKVYGILSIQLLVTSFFVACGAWPSAPLYNFYHRGGIYNAGPTDFASFLTIGASVISFIVCIMITCCTDMARKVPTNYYLLGLFTLCQSFMVGYITSFYEPPSVLLAASLTLTLTLTLTIYACTTKTDYTVCGALLWILAWGLFMVTIFAALFFWGKMTRMVEVGICLAGIVIYGFYLIYDTQLIMGGGKYALTLDDYVLAALVIYIDIIVLFIRILRLVGQRR